MRGLPAPLPQGERVLWQGSPQARPLLRRIFRTRLLLAYVAILMAWGLTDGIVSGNLRGAGISALSFAGLAAVAMLMFAGLARRIARTTIYTITTKRVLFEYGAAFEKTVQIPFVCMQSAGVLTHDDGTADIVLTLLDENPVNYYLMWPHVRPWHLSKPEPMMRFLNDGVAAAQILGRAMAADAGTPPVAIETAPEAGRSGAVAAAA